MKHCFILVNFNNSQLSIDCVNSLLPQCNHGSLIIVVDNNSNEEEKEILSSVNEILGVKLIFLPNNIGYFPAINQGLIEAYKFEFDYITVGNNDLIYNVDYVKVLNRLQCKDDVMVISPDILTIDGRHQNPNFINKITVKRKFLWKLLYSHYYIAFVMLYLSKLMGANRTIKDKVGHDKEQIIHMGFGACYCLTKSFINKIQFLDDRSFLMGEEALLMHQVDKVGGFTLYFPDLIVHHKDNATFKQMPSRFAYECHKKAFKIYKKYL
jgi:GT2 family glycosyltransferase